MIDDTNKENVDTVAEDKATPVNLAIQDLINIKNIIDVSVSRGTFKADEVQLVGATYTRLTAFLSTIVPAKPPVGKNDDDSNGSDDDSDEANTTIDTTDKEA